MGTRIPPKLAVTTQLAGALSDEGSERGRSERDLEPQQDTPKDPDVSEKENSLVVPTASHHSFIANLVKGKAIRGDHPEVTGVRRPRPRL